MNSLEENKLELPLEFLNLLEESIGSSNSEILIKRLQNERAVTSIRFNTFKNYIPENLFSDNKLEKVTWANNGFYLDQRPRFTSDPYFHAGYYYVQEASGMYMDIVKKSIEKDSNCFFTQIIISLDLCAAPGGKSTHLVSLLNDKSLLVANEVIKTRATILADNIAKWGSSNVIVSNNDPQHFTNLKEVFELVIVDAPCSGEGLFGKVSLAVKEWSLDNVKLCTQRQKRILSDVWL